MKKTIKIDNEVMTILTKQSEKKGIAVDKIANRLLRRAFKLPLSKED